SARVYEGWATRGQEGRRRAALPVASWTSYLEGLSQEPQPMCRNIKTLFNFDPPATDDEIRAASVQYVRKLSGFNSPSKANEAAFNAAIDEVFAAGSRLLTSLETNAPP